MTAGLLRGLNNEDAARFAFLLATPPIFAAGILKFSDLTGRIHLGNGFASASQAHDLRIAALIALVCSAVVAVFTVHFLTRYFRRANLIPFGIYCVLFGLAMVGYNALKPHATHGVGMEHLWSQAGATGDRALAALPR